MMNHRNQLIIIHHLSFIVYWHNDCSFFSEPRKRNFMKRSWDMNPKFQARWISKQQTHYLKKTGKLKESLVLDSLKGHILVEPAGTDPRQDDGILSPDAADYELRHAWCLGPKTQVQKARQLLGLALDPA
jgi:hypothetical protein